ncbi:MAG: hypothetical protein JNN16_17615 [Nitrospira sp.]|nr:hypothetical protein [Nitrospira sp.]
MRSTPIMEELGKFVVDFQAVEAALVDLIIRLTDSDCEYIAALTAELEFNSKARALDIIFGRFSQLHGLTNKSPHPEFHKLMVRVQKLATRRNEIVHSFYNFFVNVDGEVGIRRTPTKLKPSEGIRQQQQEDILAEQLQVEVTEIKSLLSDLEFYRLEVIDLLNPIEE